MVKDLVNVYDIKTKKITSIPAAEMAPGMFQAEVEGVGTVWIHPSQGGLLGSLDYQHPPFSEEVRDHLREITTSLDEVCPMTLEDFEDSLRRDLHVESEIALWLYMAEVYKRCTVGRNLSLRQKKEYFAVILMCSASPEQHVLNVIHVQAISKSQVRRAISLFYHPRPGELSELDAA